MGLKRQLFTFLDTENLLEKAQEIVAEFKEELNNNQDNHSDTDNEHMEEDTDEDTDEENTYTIVGPYEADISKGMISTSSPIARAIIGKAVGDSAEVQSPGGVKSYEIIAIDLFDMAKVNR